MSKLEELIEQYCPDGVEYYKIKDVYKRIKGTPITAGKMKEIATPDGSVRIFAGGKTVIDANEKDIPNANITRVPAVLIQSRGVIDAVYYDKPFTFKNEMWAYTTFNQKSVKYLYYILKSNIQTFRDAASGMGALPQISLGVTEEFEIPVPPLPVQEEIVRILDAFTELQAELQAELQKRKQQYNYYLDNLLNFKNINRGGYQAEVRWMMLKDIGKVCMCKRILKSQTSSSGDVPFFKIGTFGGNADAYISQALFNEYKAKYSYPQKGEVLISAAGTIGRTIVFDGTPSYFQDSNIVWLKHDESIVLNSYLRYCYALNPWVVSTGGTIARLYNDNILEATIPVPSLANQQRIVAILDRFDRLTNDLNAGLPAEIEKRRQQYEYYRDKLLTFKRKGA